MSAQITIKAIHGNNKRKIVTGIYNSKGIDHLKGEVFNDSDYSRISDAVIAYKRMEKGYEVEINISTELSILGGILLSFMNAPKKFDNINSLLAFVSRKIHEINAISAALTSGYGAAVEYKKQNNIKF